MDLRSPDEPSDIRRFSPACRCAHAGYALEAPTKPPVTAEQQRNQEQDQSNKEDDLCNADGRSRNPAESKNSGDQGDNQQRYDESEHCCTPNGFPLRVNSRLGVQVPARLAAI